MCYCLFILPKFNVDKQGCKKKYEIETIQEEMEQVLACPISWLRTLIEFISALYCIDTISTRQREC